MMQMFYQKYLQHIIYHNIKGESPCPSAGFLDPFKVHHSEWTNMAEFLTQKLL